MALKGVPLSAEHRVKLSAAKRGRPGRPLSREHMEKMAAGRRRSPLFRAHTEKLKRLNTGRTASQETRQKMSAAQKGRMRPPWSAAHLANYSLARRGKKLGPTSDATKAKISAAHKGKTLSPEHRAKLSLAHIGKKRPHTPQQSANIQRALHARPNKAEARLKMILDAAFPGDWRYTGDGSVVLGGKCPDFVNVNGRKAIVEMYGDYWHRGQDARARAACFAPFGYTTVVVWERELKYPMDVVKRVKEAVY